MTLISQDRRTTAISPAASLIRRRKYGVSLLLLPLLLGTAGCGKKPDTAEAGTKPGKEKPTESAGAAVTAAAPTLGSISKTAEVNGSLVALQDVTVGAKQAGKIAQVLYHEGDSVAANRPVVLLDMADLNAQVASAQAALQSAIANEQSSLTKRQQAVAALNQARSALVQAQNSLRNTQTNFDYIQKTTKTSIAVAESGVKTAKEKLSLTLEGSRAQERKQSEEQVASAKANLVKAQQDLKRYQTLYREQAVSQSQLDQAQATYDAAQAAYNSALQGLSLVREGARPQEIEQARIAMQQAEDQLRRANADKDQITMKQQDIATAKSNIESAKAGVASAQAGVAAADAGIKTAQAQVAQSRAQLNIALEAQRNGTIVSPISGYVAERKVEPGQQVGAGAAVMRIVAPNSVYFQATLPESQYAEVHLGQQADITIDALPGKKYKGKVTRILPVASSQARSFTLRIDFPADSQVRPQMFARASVEIATHTNTLLVPKTAVVVDATKNTSRVFVAKPDGTAEARDVTIGFSNPDKVEILNNKIKPDEKIIVAGQNGLSNGDKIKVQP